MHDNCNSPLLGHALVGSSDILRAGRPGHSQYTVQVLTSNLHHREHHREEKETEEEGGARDHGRHGYLPQSLVSSRPVQLLPQVESRLERAWNRSHYKALSYHSGHVADGGL